MAEEGCLTSQAFSHLNVKGNLRTANIISDGNVRVLKNLYVDSDVTFNSTTQSTDSSSGALIVSGGVGIAKNTYIGGNLNVDSDVTFNSITQSDSSTSGALVVSGGVGIAKNTYIGGNLNVDSDVTFNSITQSDDSSTGALVVSGGVGIAKNTYIGGNLNVDSDVTFNSITQSDDSSTGALVVSGGVGIAGNTNIGGNLNVDSDVTFSNTTPSNSSSTGALVVSGGVGIAKNTYIGGNANIFGNISTKNLNQFTENEIKSIAGGEYHSMILLNTGKVLSFGYNEYGQLGDGTTDSSNSPVAVDSANGYTYDNAIAISAGGLHSMILLNTGKVLSFGRNNYGQLGDGTSGDSNNRNSPVAVDSANGYTQDNAIAIATGVYHSMILLNTGKVLSFGLNSGGQLGDGSTTDSSNSPVAVDSANGYTQDNAIAIAGGFFHSMILLNTGKVLSFGYNEYDQLGDGSTTDSSNSPVAVDSANGYTQDNAIAIATGVYHSMILLNTGKVLSFGNNNYGQLGDGTSGNSNNVPVAVYSANDYTYDNAIAIATRGYHSMILLNTGKVLSFGYNEYGQLGDGTTDSSNSPVAVDSANGYTYDNAIAISAGGLHSMILLNTGKILSFGYNNYGQLGDSSNNVNKYSPVAVYSANDYTLNNLKTIYNTFSIGGNFNNAITNNYFEIYTENKYSSTDDAKTKSFNGFYPKHLNIKNTKSSSKIQFLNSNDEVNLSIGENTYIGGNLNVDSGVTFNSTIVLQTNNSNNDWTIYINDSNNLYFSTLDSSNNFAGGYLQNDSNVHNIDFTGQHRSILNNKIDEQYYGLVVSSIGKYLNLDNSLNVNINESLPLCNITNIDNDKKVFGVISNKEDINTTRTYNTGIFVSLYNKTNNNEQRMYINSVGEGGFWVCNKNGNLENGDYISSSKIPGYGMKQILNEEFLTRYTVAKITCDCNFNLTKIVKQKLKIINKNIDYDNNGDVQYEDDLNDSGNQQLEYQYDTRFLLADGTQITEEEYKTKLSAGEQVYIACFVGCTYHCG